MKVLILFFVLCSSVYANLRHSVDFKIETTITKNEKKASCVLENNVDNELTVYEGETVRVDVKSQKYIQDNNCKVTRTNGSAVMKSTILKNDNNTDAFFLEKKATKDLTGLWTCKLLFGGPNGQYNDINPMENGYTWVVCEINVKVKAIDYKVLSFAVAAPAPDPACYRDQIVELHDSDRFRIVVTTNIMSPVVGGKCYICEKGKCDDRLLPITDLEPVNTGNKTALSSAILQFNQNHMNGKTLVCDVGLDIYKYSYSIRTFTWNQNNYTRAVCLMELNLNADDKSPIIWYVVGAIVLLVIVGQTIALLICHFKAKARARNSLEDLPKRRFFNRSGNDRARYSAAPSLRSTRQNRAAADTDSHIYEMVGVNALYKDSGEMEIIERDIKNRPPLPLPGEMPDPAPPVHIETLPRPTKKPASMASTLTLNSSSSSTQLIAPKPSKNLPKPGPNPSRPPKPDESSLPGSLKRPPKPVPKTGSVPKTIVKDPGLMELKNALKKRNPGMASPTSSPVATMERKQPHAPKKPPPKQIVQPMPKPQPTNPPVPPIKPGTTPSQIKAKLEGTLKPMTPMGISQASDVVSSNVRPNPVVASPVGPSSLSRVRPNLPVASVLPVTAPPVKRPLPTPHLASRPLPPIDQEDLGQSDEEEWVYEPLEQYNLYNL